MGREVWDHVRGLGWHVWHARSVGVWVHSSRRARRGAHLASPCAGVVTYLYVGAKVEISPASWKPAKTRRAAISFLS